jgi:hypothetical protein
VKSLLTFRPDKTYLQVPSDKVQNLPIFKKAEEIRHIVEAILKYIPEEKDFFQVGPFMFENACIIGAKIAGAEGGDLYFIRMECAVQIKVAARDLLTRTNMLRSEKLCPEEYIQLLRNEIDKFRVLFIDWVAGFDKENEREDGWGDLFA